MIRVIVITLSGMPGSLIMDIESLFVFHASKESGKTVCIMAGAGFSSPLPQAVTINNTMRKQNKANDLIMIAN